MMLYSNNDNNSSKYNEVNITMTNNNDHTIKNRNKNCPCSKANIMQSLTIVILRLIIIRGETLGID